MNHIVNYRGYDIESGRFLEIAKDRIALAENMAGRSSCRQLKVGAVIVNPDDTVFGFGHNRPPIGQALCGAGNCPPPDEDGYCKRVRHAEDIALDDFCRKFRNLGPGRGNLCFSTWFPCHHCFMRLYELGGVRIFTYKYDHENCPAAKIECGDFQKLHLYAKRLEYRQELNAIIRMAGEYGNTKVIKYNNGGFILKIGE